MHEECLVRPTRLEDCMQCLRHARARAGGLPSAHRHLGPASTSRAAGVSMSAVARGGGTRTTTARAPRAGCGCKPSGADGKSCSTKACGCAKEGKGCSEQCDCGGASGASAPRCHCGLVCQLKTVAKEGPNQGRRFFPCPKPRGEGCQFFEWVPPGRGCCANPFAAGARPGQRDGAFRPLVGEGQR